MIIEGQKIQCIKNMGGVVLPGDVVTVESIDKNNMIKFNIPNYFGYGMMTYNEYLEYFTEYKESEKKTFGPWRNLGHVSFKDVSDTTRYYRMYVRTNGVRTMSKFVNDNTGETVCKARASKFIGDDYSEDTANNLCKMRLINKFNDKVVNNFINNLD